MSLRLRRGTNDERATRVFDLAEPIWVTDKQQLWIGNGTGSVDPIASYAGTGLSYSYNSTNGGRLSVNLGSLNTDSLPQGGTNKYFSSQLAQDAFAELLSNGTQDGIVFTYDPIGHALNASLDAEAFLVSSDTTPSLGGNLDLNQSDITGEGNIAITGGITLTEGQIFINPDPLWNDDELNPGAPKIRSGVQELVLEGTVDGERGGPAVRINVMASHCVNNEILGGLDKVQALEIRSYKNGSVLNGQGIASVAVSGTFSGKTPGTYTIPSGVIQVPNIITGVKPRMTITFDSPTTAFVTLVTKGSGYTSPPLIAGPLLQAVGGGSGTIVLTATLMAGPANHGDIASGDLLSLISFTGHQHSTLTDSYTLFGVQADPAGTTSSSHIPTKFFFVPQPATSLDPFPFMTFDCKGRLAVNQENALSTVDINGVMRLVKQSAAPDSPVEGMIAVADRTNWDPALVGSGGSYPVYYDGTSWAKMI